MNSKDNKDFDLISKTLKFDKYIRRNVANNIPAVHRDIKIHLLDESYNLVKYIYEAEYNRGNIRSKYLNEMIVTISLLDYLINILIELKNISKKYLLNSIYMLSEIKNRIYGWKKSEEN